MKKIILILGLGLTSLVLNANNKADTTLKINSGNTRHLVVYKSCDGVYWEVHKLLTVKSGQDITIKLKKVEGYKFKVSKHVCKL